MAKRFVVKTGKGQFAKYTSVTDDITEARLFHRRNDAQYHAYERRGDTVIEVEVQVRPVG